MKKDKDATVFYKSSEGKKLLKEAGINPEKWPEYRRLENWEPGYEDLKDRLVSGKVPEIRVTKSELEKIRKAFEDSKKFNDPEFRKKILDNLGEEADVKGILEEDENYPPSYQKLYNKYKDLSLRELLEQPDFLEHFLKSEKERMKLDLPYLKEKARKKAEEIDLRNIPEEERESYLKKKEAEILRDLKKNYNSGLLSPGQITYFSNEGENTYDMPEDEKGLNKLAKGAETYENWIKENTVPAFDSIEEIKAYLDEHYPEEELKEQLENLAENEPEVAIENKDIIPNTAKEAEQVVDSNPHNDEANNEEIKKDVGEFIKHENGLLGPKEEPPTPKFEDGLLKRDEEQQKEFDRVKEESARKAEEWRQQQFDKFANREPEEADNVSTEPQIGEQPAEDLFIDEDALESELNRLSGSKKKGGKKRLSDMDVNPLEDLEFNLEEFNKQYAIDHPEQKIQDELSDDEKNDIDYKPSKEELEVLNKANREEWEANGRPRNKDLLDKTVVDPNQQVEDAIESNPVQAEQVAEDTLGEGNPIEEEAEQVNDDIPQNDEVNNDAIESASDEDKSEFLNAMEDVVDYGLEDQNYYGLDNATLDRIKGQADSDKTIVQQENNLPDLDIEQIPEEEMRKLFDPLNKEIEARQKRVSEADEALQLAQMHFDENPNEENAKALEKANQAYKDAEFSLKYKQKEYASAYENLGNYYRPKEEDEPYFIKEVEEEKEPLKLPNIKFGKGATANGSQSSPTMDSVKMGGKSGGYGRVNGPSAGLGRIGGFGSISPVNVGSARSQNAPYRGYNGKAGGGSVPTTPNKSAPVTGHSIPHSNGSTVSSGAGMLLGKHTNYTPPTHTAPIVPILGHTSSVSGNGSVPQIGGSSKSNPKLLLISQLEAKLNELSQKNPKVIEKLGFDHKYKHWAFKGITLDELAPNQLNDLLKEVEALN